MKHIVITGATGMIGKALCNHLHQKYKITVITRNIEKAEQILTSKYSYISWYDDNGILEALSSAWGIINLSGYSIGNRRWSTEVKSKILLSRINTGKKLTKAISTLKNKPSVFIQISASGYYTSDYKNEYSEAITCNSNSFLHKVCEKWEASTKEIKQQEIRYIVARLGMVLDKNQGVFPIIFSKLKFFIGAYFGNGQQWISWIHLEDTVRAITFLLENNINKGIYNLTSPTPVTNKEFYKMISKKFKKPLWFGVPGFVLRLIFGQMASETILSSQKVIPKRLLSAGFQFYYPNLSVVFEHFLKKEV